MVDAIVVPEARVGVTWNGQYGELPDPVPYDSAAGDVLAWATEAIRGGGVPGIVADPNVRLTDYVVDRFDAVTDRPWNLFQIRPKTPFGRF